MVGLFGMIENPPNISVFDCKAKVNSQQIGIRRYRQYSANKNWLGDPILFNLLVMTRRNSRIKDPAKKYSDDKKDE